MTNSKYINKTLYNDYIYEMEDLINESTKLNDNEKYEAIDALKTFQSFFNEAV